MTTKVTIEAPADLPSNRHVIVEKRTGATDAERYVMQAGAKFETHVWKGVTLTVTEDTAVILLDTPKVHVDYVEFQPLNGPTIRLELPLNGAT